MIAGPWHGEEAGGGGLPAALPAVVSQPPPALALMSLVLPSGLHLQFPFCSRELRHQRRGLGPTSGVWQQHLHLAGVLAQCLMWPCITPSLVPELGVGLGAPALSWSPQCCFSKGGLAHETPHKMCCICCCHSTNRKPGTWGRSR